MSLFVLPTDSCGDGGTVRAARRAAGNFTLSGIAERKHEMQAAMNDALMTGYQVLSGGGMGRGYVGADGKPMIMFAVDDHK